MAIAKALRFNLNDGARNCLIYIGQSPGGFVSTICQTCRRSSRRLLRRQSRATSSTLRSTIGRGRSMKPNVMRLLTASASRTSSCPTPSCWQHDRLKRGCPSTGGDGHHEVFEIEVTRPAGSGPPCGSSTANIEREG